MKESHRNYFFVRSLQRHFNSYDKERHETFYPRDILWINNKRSIGCVKICTGFIL